MALKKLDGETLARIQEMVEVSFAGRDKLYCAANQMENAERSNICRQLADHLAGHACELQQILAATGNDPKQPLEIEALVDLLLESVRAQSGESGVLVAAENYTRDVKEGFDHAIEEIPDPDARELLRQQRNDVEFGERVLHYMERPDCSREG
jgi:uncharacterized protein (TIGR02284 family)